MIAIKDIPPCPGRMETDLSRWPIVLMRPPTTPLTDAEFRAYLDWVEKYVTCRGEPYALVNDARGTPPITASQRRLMTEQMERLKPFTKRYCAGVAMVFESAVMRGVMTAIFWMSKPDYPTKVAAEVDEAIAWCNVRLGHMEHAEARERKLGQRS